MTYLTPVLFLHPDIKRSDYEYLLDCVHKDVCLVLFGQQHYHAEFQECFGEDLKKITTLYIDSDSEHAYDLFYQAIRTPFWTIASPYEVWAENFFSHTEENLKKIQNSSTDLLYFVGFLSNSTHSIQYAQLVSPELAKTLSLNQLFDSTLWFSPFIKVVFSTAVCRELKVIPKTIASPFVNQQLLTVEYLSSLYIINNYTEPTTQYFPAPFLIPSLTEPTKQEMTIIRLSIIQKEEIWQKTLWSRTYWKSLYFLKKYEHLAKKGANI